MAESTTAAGSAGTRATGVPPGVRALAERPGCARAALDRLLTVGMPLPTYGVHLLDVHPLDERLHRGPPPETIAGGAS
ncbi:MULTISPECIES: hypothetical protein [Streptomyces]|uniref:Uncharacterized protein n=2 Tax=Streptomyces TaxID=1883 RepID=A0ABW7T579_9ACTN